MRFLSLSGLAWRTWALVMVTVLALLYAMPSMRFLPPSLTEKLPFKSRINLGLDLQGGSYLTFRVEIDKALRANLTSEIESLKDALKKESLDVTASEVTVVDKIPQVTLTGDAKAFERAKALIKDTYTQLGVVDESAGKLVVSSEFRYAEDLRKGILDQSVRVIRNRVDEFGVSEPSISTKGADKVVVELPGVKDVNQAKDLIGQTAKLEFRLVDEKSTQAINAPALTEILEKEHNLKFVEGSKLSEYTEKANAAMKSKIPDSSEIFFERAETRSGLTGGLVGYVLFKRVDVTGGDLQSAQVTQGQYGAPEVAFKFKPLGGKKFGELTEKNVGSRLAIVLDGTVKSAPNINSKITDSGVITLGRGRGPDESFKEASNLAIVLRAGALPASLELQEQRVVGPSLGEDSIRYGVTSGVIGCLVIFAFMMVYYRLSGVIATVSLLLNLLFSFAIMVGIGATLTLPGIAGLALIIGMGVDSNVLIFERMRDEILDGASPYTAVNHGFDRAFAAIFDANITHGIVGLVLYNFGTGPLKGFAVTLLIGIFTTLFCAVTVCKLMFDHYLKLQPKRVSI